MLFHNFKYVENHAFGRKKMPGSQKDISLFPAMLGTLSIVVKSKSGCSQSGGTRFGSRPKWTQVGMSVPRGDNNPLLLKWKGQFSEVKFFKAVKKDIFWIELGLLSICGEQTCIETGVKKTMIKSFIWKLNLWSLLTGAYQFWTFFYLSQIFLEICLLIL